MKMHNYTYLNNYACNKLLDQNEGPIILILEYP